MAGPIKPGQSPLDFLLEINASSIDDAANQLKDSQRRLARVQREENRKVSKKVVSWVQPAARSGTPAQRKFAGEIGPRATQNAARVSIGRGNPPGAWATFWGTKRRTGWYSAEKFRGSMTPQHPEWVGTNWDAGVKGEGPYVINDVLAARYPEIEAMYRDGYERALDRVFGGS